MIQDAKSDTAVSPVIGTILLVAIAVVLVTIILVVVMGFSGDTNEKKVGLNAKPESGNNATLILYGGASIPELIKLEMIDQGSPNGKYVELWNITNGSAYVGLPYLAKDVAQPLESLAVYDTRINVRGTFSDGSEVILLVQPMTFYDVFAEEPVKPDISLPNVQAVADTSSLSKIITVSYTNTTSAPGNLTIYYQIENGEKIPIDCGTGAAVLSPDSESFNAERKLVLGAIYEIWGEVTMNGVTYKGPVLTYTVPSTLSWNYYWINKGSPETNTIYLLDVQYKNAPAVPSEVVFCYRLQSAPEGSEVRVPLGAGNGKTYTFPDVPMKLQVFGTNYDYWAEATIDGVVCIGPTFLTFIHLPGSSVILDKDNGEPAGPRTVTVTYTKAPSDVTKVMVHYYLNSNPGNVMSISREGLWQHYQPSVATVTTIDFGEIELSQGHYTIEVEIFTELDGSFKRKTHNNYHVSS